MQNVKAFLASLSNHPGVYQMLGEGGKILYVGKARHLKKRLSNYFSDKQKDIKTTMMMKHVKNVDIIVTRNENEALLLECNLIKKHQPHYNVLFRDDKSYPYILITNDKPFPRIDFYRGVRKKNGYYFGPYPNAAIVRETIHLIQKLFGLRTCNDSFFSSRTRPCLHHQIGLCSGSCSGLISEADYQQNVHHTILFLQGKNQELIEELNQNMEKAAAHLNFELAAKYRDQMTHVRQIQERQYVSTSHGNADVIGFASSAGIVCIQLLSIKEGRMLGSRSYFPAMPKNATPEEIITSFITQHYLTTSDTDIPREIILEKKLPERSWIANALSEFAKHKVIVLNHVRSERKKWLEIANSSAKQAVASKLVNKANTKERIAALQTLLHLKKPIRRIECFDISHTMGEETVASCVVFNNEGPVKSNYRRFNISGITPGDDLAAMHQVLHRRYKQMQAENTVFPDVILIDGGATQLATAKKVLAELTIHDVILVGVAKGQTRKPGFETLHLINQPPFHLSEDSIALHFIQQIRDEAHRFAITAHRNRRDKKSLTSPLQDIPGIGGKRRRELLRYFGGIQAINRASLDELTKVPGISHSLAERIFEALHKVTI